jgi:hypothetical protein
VSIGLHCTRDYAVPLTSVKLSTSLASILGIEVGQDCVAFDGSPFEYGAKPVAISTSRGVDLMDN